MKLFFPLALLLAATTARGQQQWSQGNPTADEQGALEWLNASRRDPVAALISILHLVGADPIVDGFMKVQIPSTAAQLEAKLADGYATVQANSAQFPTGSAISNAPLVFYPLFQQQAATRAASAAPPATNFPGLRPPPEYIYPVPIFGGLLLNGPDNVQSGPNATGGTAQFGPYGANYTSVSHANLYASYLGGREWMLSLLTSVGSGSPPPAFLAQGDALPTRTLGHTRMVGLAIAPSAGGSRVLTLYKGSQEFFTQSDLPYGTTDTVFVTGVAYRDNNRNGIYDAREGIADIKVTLDHGDWFAVTASAGGYAIPVRANSGKYVLTANGGPFHGATASVEVLGDSVKCDWVLPPGAVTLPPQVPVANSDGTTQLVGLSTRGLIQTGENVLIGGFVIIGPAGARKRVLIRGVGPSLQSAGISPSECMPATRIQVFDHDRLIAENNGWLAAEDGGAAVMAASDQVGDFPLTPWVGGGGDSALVTTLAPGSYTVIVSPAPGLPTDALTGRIGLVEIYDVSRTDGGRFVNISTRGLVGAGYAQLIVGWTVAGNGHRRLLVRGIGPTLTEFGLLGILPNPVLTLYDAVSQPLSTNDDWSNSAQTEQIRTLADGSGAFALSGESLDPSILTLALPGNYSAIVGAKAGSALQGVALVELYETP